MQEIILKGDILKELTLTLNKVNIVFYFEASPFKVYKRGLEQITSHSLGYKKSSKMFLY